MCTTYQKIGSLTTLKQELEQHGIREFSSLKEVMHFQKSYATLRQQLVAEHERLIAAEKESLVLELSRLAVELQQQKQESVIRLTHELEELKQQLEQANGTAASSFFKKVVFAWKRREINRMIQQAESLFDNKVAASVALIEREHHQKNNRYQFIVSYFDEAVQQSAGQRLRELDRKHAVVNSLNNYIYGALGEQKVVKVLEQLPDDYYLINDFSVTFSPALYNRKDDDYIKSVQVDHLLVGPSGVFIIETKNWSQQSMENLSLRSPIAQIRRASYALFYLLNSERSDYHLELNAHHWGSKKIPLKSLIVLTRSKPSAEFQYVKVLTLEELLQYVRYLPPVFSSIEIKKITDRLLRISKNER